MRAPYPLSQLKCWWITVTGVAALQTLQTPPENHLRSKVSRERLSVALAAARRSCEDNFWLTLKTCVHPHSDGTTFVQTGDIPDMWIRDSAAQLHPYIPLAANLLKQSRPFLVSILEGTLRSQAKYIAVDPYSNAFHDKWHGAPDEDERRLLRGGLVATANYEMDDGPYFLRFLRNFTEAVPSSGLLSEPQIKEAVQALLDTYRIEQNHNNSHYRYPLKEPFELPGGPSGKQVAYTGMVWNAFRPSDDPHQFGYHIPGNIFLASQLAWVEEVATSTWGDADMAKGARELRESIIGGVARYGTREVDGAIVYCYEVDGWGGCSLMDDANIPSLLSLPYLDPTGKHYSADIYKSTRKFLLSEKNPWFFSGGAAAGIGSPHTGQDMIWPLALIAQAITAETLEERDRLIVTLMDTAYNGSLHESFDKDDHTHFTRPWFGWPNALFAEFLRSIGQKCGPVSDAPRMPEAAHFDMTDPLNRNSFGDRSFYEVKAKDLRFSAADTEGDDPWDPSGLPPLTSWGERNSTERRRASK